MLRPFCLFLATCFFAASLNTAVSTEPARPQVQLVVGNWLPGEHPSAETGNTSPLTSPFGVDFDAEGNMFIVELEGGRVHRRDASGQLTKIAGDGSKSYRGDGGPAAHATFNGMHNVAVVPGGDIYIADSWNHCIRKIDAKTGVTTTIAGTGEAGFSGDGGPAQKATFDYVMCISLGPANRRLYVADLKNLRIRVLDLKTGIVDTLAGNGEKGVPEDGAVATQAPLVDPRAVAVDSQGLVYVLERSGNALRAVTPDGRIRTVAGTGQRGDRNGPAREATFGSPKHLCLDAHDNVYIADDVNGLIRKYDPRSETVTSVLGRGQSNPPVSLLHPHGVCVERNMLYVVDTGNNRILRMPLER